MTTATGGWPPDKNKPISRLLFDDKISQKIKIKPKENISHFWYISEIASSNLTLPNNYSSPMTLTKISSEENPTIRYRFSIWVNDEKMGRIIWKSFIVEIVGDQEFIFTPPLSFLDLENNNK